MPHGNPSGSPIPQDSLLEARFFDISIDMLCCLGFDGYFRRLNPAWERTLGFTRDELMACPFIEFVHPDDRARTLNQNRDVRDGGQARLFENRYLCKDGGFRWLLWNATPDPGRGVIFSVARDVTERKRAELEREALVAELQSALAEVRSLRELLPICSYCRKIRDDDEQWLSVETYLARHTTTRFSHGICPNCYEHQVELELAEFERAEPSLD
jgi:PAS domain S-box-containing protein